jgi:hypothetical protein
VQNLFEAPPTEYEPAAQIPFGADNPFKLQKEPDRQDEHVSEPTWALSDRMSIFKIKLRFNGFNMLPLISRSEHGWG